MLDGLSWARSQPCGPCAPMSAMDAGDGPYVRRRSRCRLVEEVRTGPRAAGGGEAADETAPVAATAAPTKATRNTSRRATWEGGVTRGMSSPRDAGPERPGG